LLNARGNYSKSAKQRFPLTTTTLAVISSKCGVALIAGETSALSDAITAFTEIAERSTSRIGGEERPAPINCESVGAQASFAISSDKVMTPIRKPNPQFYAGYFAARVIVRRAATQTPQSPPPSTQGLDCASACDPVRF
jgi:hypothetical protein